MSSTQLADRLEAVAAELRAYPTPTDALRLLQGLSNAIDAEKVVLVADVDEHRDFEAEGCSSLKNWLRDQLHLDGKQAGQLVRSSRTLRDMPDLESLAVEGAVSLDHVDAFTYAAKHIDPMVVEQCMNPLLDLATHAAPTTVRQAVKKLRATAHPDDLDEAWIKGMDRHDLKVSVVGDGVAVTGFLPFDTGTKLKTVLQSLSAPTCAEDDRPVSIRRVTALDALLSSVLDSGLPQDKGVRPHVDLTVDLSRLAHNPETATAELAGFGTIGPGQLQQMLCDSDLTPILTAGRHSVLDVGRTHRLATPQQRKAVVNRQGGTCAGPGCRGPVVHVHHVEYWSEGGPTDLANLIGLCPRCHSAVHQGFFTIDPDTHQTHRTLRTRRTNARRTRAG
ncbi:HNH endonuclease [Aeromicrobium erythreum]|uniref:HNH nuclease domain-containing protein n=1 Tax=Aeromicrobium erythreum TaxID=2041 RepID=A0A0U4BEU5_9ACTN|nr:HNH endonuclease signature motif containing protein [Aeromicrobium erythreum]ALX06281.1 hypothetical protein AERYTH_17035 [Aeromicrobium erythreum]